MSGGPLVFDLPGGARVLFSERLHGNASSVGGPHPEEGSRIREQLRVLVGVRALARGYQVHGTTVERVRAAPEGERGPVPEERADGQATALAGVGVMVLAADCLPVALANEGAVAVVHGGWRGLAEGVLEEGVHAVRELGGDTPINAVIGPGAGACCYEVGPEVHAALDRPRGEGGLLDLRGIARERLHAAGVEEVLDVELCTICGERFFSHRREGDRAGRQAAIAWRAPS